MWGVHVCEEFKNKHLWRFSEKLENQSEQLKVPLITRSEEHDELRRTDVKLVRLDLPRPNLAEEDNYGGWEWRFPRSAWVRRRRGRGSEALPHRRRWSSGGARVWGARVRERTVERSKWSEEGERGIYRHGEKLFARRFGTNVPLPFFFTRHVSPTYCIVDIVYDRGWIE